MKDILKLLRVQHWIKNGLIFLPVIFHGSLVLEDYLNTAIGFVCFSFLASGIYVINDLRDVEKDRMHEKKRNRPIASGRVSKRTAVLLLAVLLAVSFGLDLVFTGFRLWPCVCLLVYLVTNIGYSFGWKDRPIVDVVILAMGFALRVIYGAAMTGIEASPMLLLTVLMFALYMGLGKRRNEKLRITGNTREVLKSYTENFLDKNMYMCLTLAIGFYSIWSLNEGGMLVYTVPLVVIICMRYNLVLEQDSDGDPVEVLFSDRLLFGLCVLFLLVLVAVLFILK